MKRILHFSAVLCALVTLLSTGVHASETVPEDRKQTIVDACIYNTELDITQWNMKVDEVELLFDDLKTEGRLPWYTESFSYTYRERDNLVSRFTPTNMDPQTYVRALYEQRLAEMLAEAVHPGMTPVQIALSVHDWLIANCVYDETLEANTGYDLLVNGTTVCVGYTELYMDALNRLGIPCVRVTSDEMNHAWNLVQIDGSWYHVDVTWDDPSPDALGYARHTYFLVSDQEISSGEDPHYSWDGSISCSSDRFADAWWKDVTSPICYDSSQTCYLIRKNEVVYTLCRRNEVTGEETVLHTDADHYVDTGHSEKHYAYGHYGLSLLGGKLYFGVQEAILRVDAATGTAQQVFTYDTKTNRKYIKGVSVKGNIATLALADHEGSTERTYITLEDVSPAHTHSYTATGTALPTCDTPGYTQWSCSCGITCQSDLIAPNGHSFTVSRKRIATFWSDGFSDESCDVCGFSHTRILPTVNFTDWFEVNVPYIVVWTCCIIGSVTSLLPVWTKKKK